MNFLEVVWLMIFKEVLSFIGIAAFVILLFLFLQWIDK